MARGTTDDSTMGLRTPSARDSLKAMLKRKIEPRDLVVFSHLGEHRKRLNPSQQHFEGFNHNIQNAGARVFHLPYKEDNFEDILYYLPRYENGAYGLYNGGVVDESFYEALEKAALSKGVCMINTSSENAHAMLFEKYYSNIEDLTAKSVILNKREDIEKVDLEYPLFVKGKIASNKELGWEACIVNDSNELEKLCDKTFVEDDAQIIVRELLDLKRADVSYKKDFPISREYRAYVHENTLLHLKYYWADEDPFGSLSVEEFDAAMSLIHETSSRMKAPLQSIDIGQLRDGSWKVIELGDPQHTGIAHMPSNLYIQKLCASLSK